MRTTVTTTRIDIDNAGYTYSWTKYIRQGGSANIYPSTTPGLYTFYNGVLKTTNFTWSGCLQIVHIDDRIYCSEC